MGRAWSETAREAGRRSPRAAAPQQEKSARRLVALGPQPRSGLEALAAPVGGCWADGAVTCDNARCVTERWCSRAGEQARQRATGRRGVRGHGSPRGGVRGAWRLALCALAPVSRLGGGVPECRLLWDGWDARAVRPPPPQNSLATPKSLIFCALALPAALLRGGGHAGLRRAGRAAGSKS